MLQIESLSLGYGRKTVLNNITVRVERGEMLGVIGPNGSGKSTLIKGISRTLPPKSGQVTIDGQNAYQMSRGQLARRIAVVPQNPNLPDTYTAFEIVLMGRTPHLGRLRFEGMKDFDIAWKAMEMTGTQSLAERRMNEISGGEKQRLTIARALAQQPKIILLDEPTAHLDINYQIETLEFVRKLCSEQGMTAIAVLHDLNLAAQYCGRLALLHRGKIHTEGSPEKVITAQNIKEVYGADVCVYPHPINNLPTTLISPRHKQN